MLENIRSQITNAFYLGGNDFNRKFSSNEINNWIPKSKSGKKSFAMASLTRITNDWIATAVSVNFDLHQGLSVMRARSRELVQNDPLAKKFIFLLKKNVIGPAGFTLKVKSFDLIKTNDGLKQNLDKFANRLIQDRFWYWMKKKNCSITENTSFRELEEQILSTAAIDGECFIMHLKGKEYGYGYGYTTQIIDAGMVDEAHNKVLSKYDRENIKIDQPGSEVGTYIQMGIEYNSSRKVTAYYLRKSKPQDEIFYSGYYLSSNYYRVPAEDICHLFVKEFANQGRGIPWFAPAALRMQMLNKASEAALINFRIGATKALVLEPNENAPSDPDIEDAEEKDPFGNVLENVEPGQTYKIPHGYKGYDYNPQYPNSEFGIFTDAIMMQIASAMDVTHPSLSSSYKGTTWTSSRTALIDERDGWKRLQNWFIEHLLDDVYANWLRMALLSAKLSPLPPTKFEKFNEPFWYGRKWDWVDPEKEENARIKQFKYKFKTFTEIIGADNKDLEEHLEDLAAEKELFEKYDIEFPADIPIDSPPDPANQAIENNNSQPKNGKAIHYG